MLFKVGNEIIDTDITPVGLIFKDKDEAKNIGHILSNIKNGSTELPTEDNGNWWFMTPTEWSIEEKDKWSVLTDEQKDLLYKSGKVTPIPSFEL